MTKSLKIKYDEDLEIDVWSCSSSSSSDSYSHWFDADNDADISIKEEWDEIERYLYDEPGTIPLNKTILEECKLWKDAFPYFRVSGRYITLPQNCGVKSEDYIEEIYAVDDESLNCVDRFIENIPTQAVEVYKPNILSIVKNKRDKIKNQVLKHIITQLQPKLTTRSGQHIPKLQDSAKKPDKSLENEVKNEVKSIDRQMLTCKTEEKFIEKPVMVKVEELASCNLPKYNFSKGQFFKNVENISFEDKSQQIETDCKEPTVIVDPSPYNFLLNKRFDETKQGNEEILKPILKSRKEIVKTIEEEDDFKVENVEFYFERGKQKEIKPNILPPMKFTNNWLELSDRETTKKMMELEESLLKKYGKKKMVENKNSRTYEDNIDRFDLNEIKRRVPKLNIKNTRIQSSRDSSIIHDNIKHDRMSKSSKPNVKHKVKSNYKKKILNNKLRPQYPTVLPPISNGIVNIEFQEPKYSKYGQIKKKLR